MKKLVMMSLVLGSMLAAEASQARVFQCTARNARGFTFEGYGYLKLMARQRALDNCRDSRWTRNPATCRIIDCD